MEMWPVINQAVQKMVPKEEIVFDKFHVQKHVNEAVNNLGRQEQRQLLHADDDGLNGTRQFWLYFPP
jgi:transposase